MNSLLHKTATVRVPATHGVAHSSARGAVPAKTAHAGAHGHVGHAIAHAHAAIARVHAPIATGGEHTPLHLGSTTTAHSAAAGSSSILRTIAGLLIVVGVIYGVAWVLRRVKRRGGQNGRASGTGLATVATLPLGPGRSLALVRAGREVVLVGIGEHGVTPIRTYSETEAVEIGIPLRSEEEQADHEPATALSDRLMDRLRRLTVRS